MNNDISKSLKVQYITALATGNTERARQLEALIDEHTMLHFHTTNGEVAECSPEQAQLSLSVKFIKSLQQ